MTTKILEWFETQWNRGTVEREDSGDVLMRTPDAFYAVHNPLHPFSGYYWDALAAAVLLHPRCGADGRDLRVLMIGLGGATVLHAIRGLLLGCELVVAEIDPKMVEIARRHFALDATGATVVVGDGYAADLGLFDVVLDDAFVSFAAVTGRPVHVDGTLTTGLAQKLRLDGVLAVNVFNEPGMFALIRARLAMYGAFPGRVDLVPPVDSNMVLCGGRELDMVGCAQRIMSLPSDARAAMKAIDFRAPGRR